MASEDGVFEIPDAAGNTLRVHKIEGRLWPTFHLDKIRGVKTFKARDDDVFVLAYPKSGTHWLWEIVRLLRTGSLDVPEVEKDLYMLEDVFPKDLEAHPSPRTLNTHAHFDQMPQDVIKNNNCKLLYVTRDPRDVAVSFYNHHYKLKRIYFYDGQWKDYFPNFIRGQVDYESWFAYTKGWEQGIQDNPDLQVYITSYEAFQEDTAGEIAKLAKFLDVSSDQQFIEQVAKKASFDNMRNTKGNIKEYKAGEEPIMYRKGKVGDWKNWFTVAQSEEFDEFFEKEMKGTRAYQLYSRVAQGSDGSRTSRNES